MWRLDLLLMGWKLNLPISGWNKEIKMDVQYPGVSGAQCPTPSYVVGLYNGFTSESLVLDYIAAVAPHERTSESDI